jgi:death-on-curing protein
MLFLSEPLKTLRLLHNHPTIDGNKRTGFAAAVVFLEDDGLELRGDAAEAATIFEELAAGRIDEAALATWLRANVAPPAPPKESPDE